MQRTCRTCRYWDQRYPQNTNLGVCPRLGALTFRGGDVALVLAWGTGTPTTDVPNVRTTSEFGCLGHTAHGALVTTADLRDRPDAEPVQSPTQSRGRADAEPEEGT